MAASPERFDETPSHPIELQLIPAPENPLTPGAAREWLGRWAPEYLTVLGMGYSCEEQEDRDAYAHLAGDVRSLLEACLQAIEQDAPVPIDERVSPIDESERRHQLALLVATQSREGDGAYEAVYDLLACRLAELLAPARRAS